MIGRGLIKTDDHIKFGKVVDKLSQYCYTVMYVPSKDYLIICFHKKHLETIKSKFKPEEVKVPKKGVLAFGKVKWRT